MPMPAYLVTVVEQQEAIVTDLTDPRVDHAARFIAFYAAMIDAAKDDPMDTEEEQNDALAYFNDKLTHWVEHYQKLINELL